MLHTSWNPQSPTHHLTMIHTSLRTLNMLPQRCGGLCAHMVHAPTELSAHAHAEHVRDTRLRAFEGVHACAFFALACLTTV